MDDPGRDPRLEFRGPSARDRRERADGPGTGRRPRRRCLDDLRPLVRRGHYRIGRHAARHAATEGFTEPDIVAAVLHGRELMRYVRDERLLVLGWLPVSREVRLPLHVVLEFSRPRWVDVVTAFIPDDPHRVASRRRLAEALRWDAHEPRRELVGEDGT